MKKDTKQRLFEVMSRLDSTFKVKLNEDYDRYGEFQNKIKNGDVWLEYYPPSSSQEYTDGENWWNRGGQQLRSPREYDRSDPEWTPFGDEGDEYDDDLYENITEEKSSYSTEIINDINVLLGNRDTLPSADIDQIATSHNVDREEVLRTLDYVKSGKQDKTALVPSSSVEAEQVNDFFKFLNNNPQKGSKATVEYVSNLNRGLAKPKQNPMVDRFIKLTKYMFEWERTYKKEVEKVNPEWELQKRKGDYSKMEGGYENVMERDARGDEVLPIVPRNPQSIILVLDETGNVVDKVDSNGLQEKYGEFFTPSFFKPYTSGSGADFRPLKLYAINRIAAGGKKWVNPKLKPEFEKYRQHFNDLNKSLSEEIISEKRFELETFYNTQSEAVDAAVQKAESMGYEVDKDDIWRYFGEGWVGYENYRKGIITLYKNGVEQRKSLVISLYRMPSGKYELTTYIN